MHRDHPSPTTEFQDVKLRKSLIVTPAMVSATPMPGPERHSVENGFSSRQGAGSDNKRNSPKPTGPMQRSVYIVFLTLLYGGGSTVRLGQHLHPHSKRHRWEGLWV